MSWKRSQRDLLTWAYAMTWLRFPCWKRGNCFAICDGLPKRRRQDETVAKQKFKDVRGAHARIYWSLLDSPAWFALSYSQRALFVACRRRLTSNNNGNLAFTMAGLAMQGFTASSSTLASGLRALQAVGFIAVTREGGKVNRGQAIPTLYRFTDEECHQWVKLDIPSIKPSNEWRQFPTVQAATHAINAAELKARADHARAVAQREQRAIEKNTPIRKSKRDGSKFKVVPIRNSKPGAFSGFENQTVNDTTQIAATRSQ